MSKKVILTIILVVIGLSSITCGSAALGSGDKPQKQESQTKAEIQAKKDEEAKKKEEIKKKEEEAKEKEQEQEKNKENKSKSKWLIFAWFTYDSENERGIQKSLSDKSKQIMGVWASLKAVNGYINVLQSAQTGNRAETSVNPMEYLAPIDNVLDKISNLLLWAFGAVIFGKIFLAISGYVVLLIIIPLCVIISIIAIWINKDKSKITRVAVVSALVILIVLFAMPISFYLSSFIEKKILANNLNTVLTSITEKGNTAEKLDKELTRVKKIGNSTTTYLTNAKNLGGAIIEETTNYFIVFIFSNIVIPILTMLGLFFLALYSAKIILKKQKDGR